MVRITRSSVLLKVQDLLGLQSGAEAPPVDCPNSIQPVIEVGPKFTNIVRSSSQTSSSSTFSLYTTPSDKDFYLTFADLSITKDVNSDNIVVFIQIVSGGATYQICSINTQTLTAYSDQKIVSFSYPIKVDRNTNIVMAGTFTAGAITKRGCIGGFILE